MKAGKPPSYRLHKARNLAVVTILGKNHYLGEYDSAASWEAYHRLIAEFLAAKQLPPPPKPNEAPLTITELIQRYWRHVKTYYVKNGQPTSEVHVVKLALRFVRKLYGSTPASEFSPKKLKAVREGMIEHEIARMRDVTDAKTGETHKVRKVYRKGIARKCINRLIGKIRRMFSWAVEEELIGVEVHAALLRVSGLKKGKSNARETQRVRPVNDHDIEAVLPLVPRLVRVMIELQQLCGGRPQDIVQMRAVDIDRSGPVWEYRPPRFKTEHHTEGEVPEADRVLFLGPKCQALLAPLIEADPAGYLFSPKRAESERSTSRRENRLTKLTPSQAARQPKTKRKKPLSLHYPVASYRRAIARACEQAGIPAWSPNRLRHSRLTEIRKIYGLEASRVVGGHREVGVTQIYAEQDHDLARKVMAEVG